MTITFPSEERNKISTAERPCQMCGRKMVSRRRYEQLFPEPLPRKTDANGRAIVDTEREYVRHGSRGYCTTCINKAHPPNRTPRKREHKPKPREEREPTPSEIWREEWEWLRSFGVSPEEASRRLGVKVDTLRGYKP